MDNERDDIRCNSAVEQNTSDLIIGITNIFNSEQSYDSMMMDVLRTISDVLHPDRLLIFERGENTTSCTFEWHAENMPPRKHTMQSIGNDQFDSMSTLANNTEFLESGKQEFKKVDKRMAERFTRNGVNSIMAVPLLENGMHIGYLSANNCRIEDDVDAKRMLETVAPFISSKILSQRLVNKLRLLGTHDELTCLLNRRGIDEAIALHLKEFPNEPYALALMDIDDFKIVNDLYGHDVGDAALRTLARFISEAFPEGALIGRNGGDEFLAMLFGDDLDKIGALLETFFNASFECELNGKKYPLSMSVGYAEFPSQAHDLQDAYTKADAALYAVKLAGKSGCKQYKPAYESQYRSQLGFTPRDIAENIPCGIAVCKATEIGEILYANEELVRMFECDSLIDFMEYTGGTFEGMVHPEDRANTKQEIIRQSQDPAFRRKAFTDHRIVTKTGTIKHMADNSRMVSVPKVGEVAYVLIVDLGERIRFQQL